MYWYPVKFRYPVVFCNPVSGKFYRYLKPTQTGENKNQPTKPQMTDSLAKFKTFLKKLTVKNCIERN